MSDTTQHDAPALEPSQTETQPAQETAPPPGTEQTPPADPPAADPAKTALDSRDRAIRAAAFDLRETRRQLQAAREQLERNAPPRDPNAPPSQADFDRQVEQRAAAIIEQREAQTRTDGWMTKGNTEFTPAVFTERCNELAALGAGENPAFMAAIGDLSDGHKVIAELATDPAEATRLLKLSPVRMAIELATLNHKLANAPPPTPKPTSQAPPPIRPLATAARGEVNLETLEGAAFRSAFLKRLNNR